MYVICAISDSNKHFQTPIDEYLKRLGKSIDLVDLKPTKHWSRQQIITQETEKILTKITKLKSKWYRIVLLIKEGTNSLLNSVIRAESTRMSALWLDDHMA